MILKKKIFFRKMFKVTEYAALIKEHRANVSYGEWFYGNKAAGIKSKEINGIF